MSIEQRIVKFNNEKFSTDFKLILGKYLEKSDDETQHLDSFDKELMRQLIDLCINALKSSDNKQEILDIISKTYIDLAPSSENNLESQYWIEKEFFKKVILESFNASTRN